MLTGKTCYASTARKCYISYSLELTNLPDGSAAGAERLGKRYALPEKLNVSETVSRSSVLVYARQKPNITLGIAHGKRRRPLQELARRRQPSMPQDVAMPAHVERHVTESYEALSWDKTSFRGRAVRGEGASVRQYFGKLTAHGALVSAEAHGDEAEKHSEEQVS